MKKCQQCGAEVPPDARLGLCPQCLLAVGSHAPAEDTDEFGHDIGAGHRRFGDYDLGEQLGRGGMGVVYRATQVSLRRPVAVKMILDALLDSTTARRRFMIEAEAAAKLDHPNIVGIYEVGEYAGQPFLSMKLIQGESLRAGLARGERGLRAQDGQLNRSMLNDRQRGTVELMASVTRAVHHAHQKGVLHRDLKPGNILLDQEGQPHLTDFGLAKLLEQNVGDTAGTPRSQSGTAQGTPSYMAPEQAMGHSLTPAADIYSLGAILYELLTGQPPFKAHTPLETLKQVVEQPARRPRALQPGVALDLETICLKCLEKVPENRYESALALAEDLDRWLRGEPIKARPAGPALRAGRWIRRNPVGAALIGSLCAGLLAAAGLLVVLHERQKQLERFRETFTMDFIKKVEDLWRDPARSHVTIESEWLAAIALLPQQEVISNASRFTLALNIADNPLGRAQSYARLLRQNEERMERQLGSPIRLDLALYRNSSRAFEAVARGEVDFQRFSALNYVRAKEISPGIEPVVQQVAHREGVIFARGGISLTNLNQAVGKRIAFAHTNSVISFWAKICLIRAGVTPSKVAYFENLNLAESVSVKRESRAVALEENASAPAESAEGEEGPELDERFSHAEVIRRVLAGEFDVGEAPRRHFRDSQYKRPGLVELHRFVVPENLIVAKSGMDRSVIEAFRQSLLALDSHTSEKLLKQLHPYSIEGYERVLDADFEMLREALTSEAALFDRPHTRDNKTTSAGPPNGTPVPAETTQLQVR